MTTVSAEAWEQFLREYPNAHLLQTAAWGQFKNEFGWQVERVLAGSAGAQIGSAGSPPASSAVSPQNQTGG